jgi:PTS system nitrogen regulatory IIA component
MDTFPVNFLITERISCGSTAVSKKRVLEEVARLLASSNPELSQDAVFDKLLERERLGSTGLGQGIALPHARMHGVSEACGAFVQLTSAAEFDAMDSQPVDLVFGLLVPEEATQEHLQLLATLAALFSNAQFCLRLRQARSSEELMSAFQEQNR